MYIFRHCFQVSLMLFQLLFGFGLPLLLLLDGAKQQERHSSSDRILKIILQYITFHSVKVFICDVVTITIITCTHTQRFPKFIVTNLEY